MASGALRSSKINDVVKGKLSSNRSAGKALSRHGTRVWFAATQGAQDPLGEWIHGAVGSMGQWDPRGSVPSVGSSTSLPLPAVPAQWPQGHRPR